MSLKDIDWKQLLLEKGERIGLALAGVVAFVLTVLFLFWPESGLLATSPTEIAGSLKQEADKVERLLNSNKPRPADLPVNPDAPLVGFTKNEIKRPSEYVVGDFFPRVTQESTSRRQPELLLPDEGAAAVVAAQIKSYIFKLREDREPLIYVLQTDAKAGPMGNKPGGMQLPPGLMRQAGGMMSGQRGMMSGAANQPKFGAPNTRFGQNPDEAPRKEMKMEPMELSKLETLQGSYKLAETVRPTRLAYLVASFPLKQQLDEFRAKLRLGTYNAVLDELSTATTEGDEADRQQLPAFRFLGVRVQRRAVDATGKPLAAKGDGWEDVDIQGSFRPYMFLTGRRAEADLPELAPLKLPGLVMPRLPQVREGQYPDLEKQLKNISSTIDSMVKAKSDQQPLLPPSPFQVKGLDVFDTGAAEVNPMGPKGPRMDPRKPPAGMKPGEVIDSVPPGHCLVRLFDVTIKPGTIYQYRLQVRLANPNYKRTDVASPSYAEDPELKNNQWFELQQPVVVPPEMAYYVVDQKAIEQQKAIQEKTNVNMAYTGINADVPLSKDRQVAFQIHRWLENVGGARDFIPVGEWSVAERIVVNRGEYIGRPVKVDVPIWKETMEAFVLAAPPVGFGRQKSGGLEVNFGNADSLLVDFEGPEFTHQRGAVQVKENATTEALILTNDGKLLAHDSRSDENNEERRKRLEAWRERIKEVKENRPAGIDPKGGNPFK